ncbi:hypothetical protein G7K_3754-t1 [Saitoella complicata NRRL Y-17804]|uniref:Something about silencing protein 4 domain-containing protein n=2 Tax=Saitoella complicata (strain BCRC 22490 / CBS 7301 / JCM 7358 / NBRC 10748 / NRRL Y-17804) TaxID=698492 RepID=A0A0E9NJM2_SAICN|nr:hypothetical protein G7K_3754-t1 [Saitoella complicata NRRL Y-17804]
MVIGLGEHLMMGTPIPHEQLGEEVHEQPRPTNKRKLDAHANEKVTSNSTSSEHINNTALVIKAIAPVGAHVTPSIPSRQVPKSDRSLRTRVSGRLSFVFNAHPVDAALTSTEPDAEDSRSLVAKESSKLGYTDKIIVIHSTTSDDVTSTAPAVAKPARPTIEVPLFRIIDDTSTTSKPPPEPGKSPARPLLRSASTSPRAVRKAPPSLSQAVVAPEDDPLGDDIYHKAHQKPFRSERHLLIKERERIAYEKLQLEREFEILQGLDWMRVVGPILHKRRPDHKFTHAEYETERTRLIEETRSVLEKYRIWKAEEARKKKGPLRAGTAIVRQKSATPTPSVHEEAIVRKKKFRVERTDPNWPGWKRIRIIFKGMRPPTPTSLLAAVEASKLRGKNARKSGRVVTAWGEPLPRIAIADRDFTLPYWL